MKNLLNITVGLFLTFNVFGQIQQNKEIILVTDRSEYISGENIWFKSYLQGELEETSLIYAELISPFGYVTSRKQILINCGKGNGNFVLPDTISTGYYTFLVYTNGLKNKPHHDFYTKSILIYNPEKKIITRENKNSKLDSCCLGSTIKSKILNEMNQQGNFIDITGLEKTYETRDKISFAIKSNTKLNACISIKKKNILNNNSEYTNKSTLNNSRIYYHENKGVILSGQINTTKQKPLENIKTHLCSVDSISIIQTTLTDTNGRFRFLLNTDNQMKDVVIKAELEDSISIILDNKFINTYDDFKGSLIQETDSTFKNNLDELYINYRISKLYKLKQETLAENKQLNESDKLFNNSFYDYADKVIKFDNYVLLDSIHEYFYEFFPSVTIQKRNGKREFRVISEIGDVLLSQPAIFINGVLYSNTDILFSINPKICDRIEVVKSNYLIYDKIYGGIISLYTKLPKSDNVLLPINSSRVEFLVYDTSTSFSQINSGTETPNFPNTLYWNPNIDLNDNSEITIEFKSGDDIGEYELEIIGLSETNELIKEHKTFSVIK